MYHSNIHVQKHITKFTHMINERNINQNITNQHEFINKTVVNLSKRILSNSEKSVLSKEGKG